MQQRNVPRRFSRAMAVSAPATALVFSLATVLPGCGRADSTPPVASVSATLANQSLTPGSPVEITYRFALKPEARISGDYRVFVHVFGPDGQRVWTDDHEPPVRTTEWTPGQSIEYTRTGFVPTVAVPGPAAIQVGLYNETGRLPLEGPSPDDRPGDRSYRVASLEIRPDAESIFLIYGRGWHPDEFSPEDASVSWKWTTGSAVLSIRNPRKDASLFLEYAARPDLFPEGAQQVTVTTGDHVLDRFTADAGERRLRRIEIRADQFGADELTAVHLDVTPTVVPAARPGAGQDTRELGIQVYHAFVQGR